jgi:hypothetical protein
VVFLSCRLAAGHGESGGGAGGVSEAAGSAVGVQPAGEALREDRETPPPLVSITVTLLQRNPAPCTTTGPGTTAADRYPDLTITRRVVPARIVGSPTWVGDEVWSAG